MAAIKFVRKYQMYGRTYFDVVYNSFRVYSFTPDDLPKTARRFIDNASETVNQFDRLFNRTETIYM